MSAFALKNFILNTFCHHFINHDWIVTGESGENTFLFDFRIRKTDIIAAVRTLPAHHQLSKRRFRSIRMADDRSSTPQERQRKTFQSFVLLFYKQNHRKTRARTWKLDSFVYQRMLGCSTWRRYWRFWEKEEHNWGFAWKQRVLNGDHNRTM